MNGCVTVAGFDPAQAKETLNRWIASETQKATQEITSAIEAYRFNDAAGAVYRFVWNVFCDWYLELAKPVLSGVDGPAKTETRAMTAWVRDVIFKLLHPFMPFLTEELWQLTAENGPAREGLLTLSPWPQPPAPAGEDDEGEIGWVIDLVTAIRSVRSEMMIPAGTAIPLVLVGVAAESDARVGRWAEVIKRLARLSSIAVSMSVPEGAVQLLVRGDTVALPLKGIVDFSAEQARLEKEISRAEADIARIDTKLNNPNFVSRAAEEVVEQERERREEAEARRLKIIEALERLKGAA
jgi:valyl-tRNA synthetase